MNTLIGKKVGMTQIIGDNGKMIPVTVLEMGPCFVVQVKTENHDGYSALQLGYGSKREKNVTLPLLGIYKKAGVTPCAILKEVRIDDASKYEAGQEITCDIFNIGEKVHVTGTTKGRGFQGVIKRHGFHGGKQSHGVRSKRVPGSIGQCTTPGRVFKGKKLPGRMGGKRVTIKNLIVVKIDTGRNLVLVKGAVPGAPNSYVMVRKASV